MMTSGRRQLGALCVLAVQALWAGQADAAGALAVGVAPGGAQRGFSYGLSYNKSTKTDAQAAASELCRTAKESNDNARSRCVSVGAFENQCVSIAMDPKDGTPGVGWAIAADMAAAKVQALANCEATAGPGRSGTCKVTSFRCDGLAK